MGEPIVRRIPLRKPYNRALLLGFLEGRTQGGGEAVSGTVYRRRLAPEAWVEADIGEDDVRVTMPRQFDDRTDDLLLRMRRLLDLDADGAVIDGHLVTHPELAVRVEANPGIRVPGVWDPFEGVVRAILGQQVSVARATNLAEALCDQFGGGEFPSPQALAVAEVAALGMPGTRGRAISQVAQRVADEGDGWLRDADSLRHGFVEIRGLGPWTAEYAAMRVSKDPDAFPDSDWGVFKALGFKGKAAREWAEPCRPWRAYATMLLWSSMA